MPRKKRKIATIGWAASAEMELKTTAPKKAPMPPGTAIQPTLPQSTLPNLQCETPDASVVPTSDKCTAAEAAAGAIPTVNNNVVEVTPYAIPKDPSTNCAMSPTIPKTIKLLIFVPSLSIDIFAYSFCGQSGTLREGGEVVKFFAGHVF